MRPLQGRYHHPLVVTKKRFISALGAFFVLAIGIAGCGSGVPGNSVADVAGNPITLQAWKHWMVVVAKLQAAQNPGQPVVVANDPPNFTSCVATIKPYEPKNTKAKQLRNVCSQLSKSYSSQVMGFLITSYWYQAEAARQHINVNDKTLQTQFNKAIKSAFPTTAQFQSFLNETGQTKEDLLFRFRVQDVQSKLLAKHNTKVTPAQIEQYYSSHKSQFGTAQARDIRIVLTKTKAEAQAAEAALKSGKSWDDVAKKYSIDASTKNKGGLLSGVTQGSQDTALDSAAFAAPANKLEGPVKGQFGYYIFEVTKVKPGTQQSLAQATPLIKQTLTTQLQNNAQTAVENTAKKHWLSKTTCRAAYAMADCSGYKAPKTSTTTSTTG
jgi:foldase protein PrsA